MINKKLKKLSIIALLIILLTFNVDKIKADEVSAQIQGVKPTGENSSSDAGDSRCENPQPGYYSTGQTCVITPYIKYRHVGKIIEFYNSEDIDIEEQWSVKDEHSIIAGTAIGASLYEYIKIEWDLKASSTVTWVKPEKTVATGKCVMWDIDEMGKKKCVEREYVTYKGDSYSCSTKPDAKCLESMNSKDNRSKGYDLAYNELINTYKEESYYVTVTDPNDINCSTASNKTEGCKNYTVSSREIITKAKGSYYPNPVVKTFYYELYGACVNVKTATVRYLTNSNEKCDKESEILVENNYDENIRHWHIFTPLNTKSNQNFVISLNSKRKEQEKMCLAHYNKYKTNAEYKKYIKPLNGEYTGTPIDKKTIEKEGGCYFSSTFNIPISQEFYNEETKNDKIVFKGFNFYYKPIDINNLFPNGVASDSYWHDLYDAVNNTVTIKNEYTGNDTKIDLSSSFTDGKTYVAVNIDTDEIREYNNVLGANGQKINLYSSWANMNTDGTSQFITNKNIITRLTNDKIYKLGCGPHNINEYLDANKTQKNPYYQKECVN